MCAKCNAVHSSPDERETHFLFRHSGTDYDSPHLSSLAPLDRRQADAKSGWLPLVSWALSQLLDFASILLHSLCVQKTTFCCFPAANCSRAILSVLPTTSSFLSFFLILSFLLCKVSIGVAYEHALSAFELAATMSCTHHLGVSSVCPGACVLLSPM